MSLTSSYALRQLSPLPLDLSTSTRSRKSHERIQNPLTHYLQGESMRSHPDTRTTEFWYTRYPTIFPSFLLLTQRRQQSDALLATIIQEIDKQLSTDTSINPGLFLLLRLWIVALTYRAMIVEQWLCARCLSRILVTNKYLHDFTLREDKPGTT